MTQTIFSRGRQTTLLLTAAFVIASAVLLICGAGAAQQDGNYKLDGSNDDTAVARQSYDPEYERIVSLYAQVAKYYNGNLPDAHARYIAQCILYYSTQYGIDPRLVVSLIVVESRFKPEARSRKGAQGLGQLMPSTADYLGVNNPFDVRENIYGTVKYLSEQYQRWAGAPNVIDLMLAAYNAGPNAVVKYGGPPPYSETRNYIIKVKKLYKYFTSGQ